MFDNTDQTLNGWDADYEGFMVPASEGGKGPANAREVLALECNHHYGITVHTPIEDEDNGDTVYRLIREVWHAPKADRSTNVLDDNHTWENIPAFAPGRFAKVLLRKNEKSPAFINILNIPRWNYEDGAGAKWFDQEYRLATVGMIAAELANNTQKRTEYLTRAAAQRDTIRGRKEAKKLRSSASDCERRNRVIIGRYPQLADLALLPDEELVAA